jgi:hypothetical protein
MPITYVFDQGENLVRTTVAGAVTVQQILDHLTAQQKGRTIVCRELVDVCGVTPPYFSSSQVWQTAQAALAVVLKERAGPRAIFVANDAIYGMCRMFATLVEDTFPIRVFRDMSQAEHWLLEEFQVDASGASGADSVA